MDGVQGNLGIEVVVPFGAALLGGVLSLLGTYYALTRSHSFELQRAEDLKRKKQAEQAYATFHKLHLVFETAANYSLQIDSLFKLAEENGRGSMDPWAKVTEIISFGYREEVIAPEETSFLIAAGQADLLNDVHIIQRRVWNILASIEKYNELREELGSFLLEHQSEMNISDGTLLSAQFDENVQVVAEAKIVRVQSLLGQIMESLESDKEEALRVVNAFKAASEEYFGDLFPKFHFGVL